MGYGTFVMNQEAQAVPVQSTSKNKVLADGVLTADTPFAINPTKARAVIIALKGGGTGTEDVVLGFEQNVDGLGWLPWKDGQGNDVLLEVKGDVEGVFGGFQGFPYFEGGRIRILKDLMSDNMATDKVYEGYYIPAAGRAFNNSVTMFYENEGTSVGVEFDETKTVDKVILEGRDSTIALNNFSVQGSNDNESWTTLHTDVLARANTSQTFLFENSTAYTFYRILGIDNHGHASRIEYKNIRMFQNQDATNISADKTYFATPEFVLAPSAENAFKDNPIFSLENVSNIFLVLDLGEARISDKISVVTDDTNRNVDEFNFEGSNDNSTWVTLTTDNLVADGTEQEFTFINTTAYRYYRFHAVSNSGHGTITRIPEIKVFEADVAFQIKVQEVL